jgi:hypothetical protein
VESRASAGESVGACGGESAPPRQVLHRVVQYQVSLLVRTLQRANHRAAVGQRDLGTA